MRRSLLVIVALVGSSAATLHSQKPAASFEHPFQVVESIPAPESVAVGPDGAWYVSSFGKSDKGDGAVYRVDPEKGVREIFAGGLDDPCGLLFIGNTLWVADREGVYRVRRGKVELVFAAKSFPRPLHFLNDLAAGPRGTLYVSDTGDSTVGGHGAVFLLAPGQLPKVVPGSDKAPADYSPNGLFSGTGDTLYVVGYRTGMLSHTDGRGTWRRIASGLGSADGIDTAPDGAYYVSDNVGGYLYSIPSDARGNRMTLVSGLKAPADLVVDRTRGLLIVPENAGNRLTVYRILEKEIG
jgi:gluconolactonase